MDLPAGTAAGPRAWRALLLALLGLFLLWAAGSQPALARQGDGHIAWQPFSYEAALKALEAGTPVVVDFRADWCQPCRAMEATTFRDARVVEILSRFAAFKVDVTGTPDRDGAQLASDLQVSSIPRVFFIRPSGRADAAYALTGYASADEFLERARAFLENLAPAGKP